MYEINSRAIRLLVVEKDEIYRYMYESEPLRASVNLLGVSTEFDIATVKHTISTCQPDILLIGTKRIEGSIIEGLGQIREDYPEIGIVLLLVSHSNGDIEKLLTQTAQGNGGFAVYLKQSLDRIEQLMAIIVGVGHGQVILDPILAKSVSVGKLKSSILEELTRRESEILGLLSNGYTNSAIAATLCIEVKTVEHHLNNIYGKLQIDAKYNGKHPRVTATMLYLRESGELVPNSA